MEKNKQVIKVCEDALERLADAVTAITNARDIIRKLQKGEQDELVETLESIRVEVRG